MPETEQPQTPSTEHTGLEWLKQHQRYLMAGGIAVAAILLVGWFLIVSGRRKEAFATEALERARDAADAGNLPQAATELQRVIESFGGTDAAMEATLSLNVVRMESGQTQLAADDLSRFLATNPPARFATEGYMLLGTAQENLGQFAEAGKTYHKAADTAIQDFMKAKAFLAAARAFRAAGKNEDAKAVLGYILDKYPETSSAAEAQVRLGELMQGKL